MMLISSINPFKLNEVYVKITFHTVLSARITPWKCFCTTSGPYKARFLGSRPNVQSYETWIYLLHNLLSRNLKTCGTIYISIVDHMACSCYRAIA